jgi:hypothetical protein
MTRATKAQPATPAEDASIRPFRIDIPQRALDDLRRRIAATKWPERETAADSTRGVQLATMRELARYWQTDYDWRKVGPRSSRYADPHLGRGRGRVRVRTSFIKENTQ